VPISHHTAFQPQQLSPLASMATAVVQQASDAGPARQQQQDLTVQLNNLQFSYPGCDIFLKGVSLDLPKGSRTLLLGANGAGKTTLLQLIAGKYMVGRETIRVLQHSPFYDMVSFLSLSGEDTQQLVTITYSIYIFIKPSPQHHFVVHEPAAADCERPQLSDGVAPHQSLFFAHQGFAFQHMHRKFCITMFA
jgi:energy-coupling factor transporter ATP-binding protein EcfA2